MNLKITISEGTKQPIEFTFGSMREAWAFGQDCWHAGIDVTSPKQNGQTQRVTAWAKTPADVAVLNAVARIRRGRWH